jgi:hypothetical protein
MNKSDEEKYIELWVKKYTELSKIIPYNQIIDITQKYFPEQLVSQAISGSQKAMHTLFEECTIMGGKFDNKEIKDVFFSTAVFWGNKAAEIEEKKQKKQ